MFIKLGMFEKAETSLKKFLEAMDSRSIKRSRRTKRQRLVKNWRPPMMMEISTGLLSRYTNKHTATKSKHKYLAGISFSDSIFSKLVADVVSW